MLINRGDITKTKKIRNHLIFQGVRSGNNDPVHSKRDFQTSLVPRKVYIKFQVILPIQNVLPLTGRHGRPLNAQ